MKIFELRCKAYLKRDLNFKDSYDAISKYISYSMMQTDNYKTLHSSKAFKHYVFDSFYPLEKDKVYKKDKVYSFTLRSLNGEFIEAMQEALRQNINNPIFLVIETVKKDIKQFFIKELYSQTPVVITVKRGLYWSVQKDGDVLKLIKQLQDNLEKKYKSFYGKELSGEKNFIQVLELKNRVPQSVFITKNKQKVRLFGNKFKIIPNEDEISQKLAFLALGAGMGEKNSFGAGFCVAKGLK